ncbi:DUF1045 domain-containing protein, partial [Desulfovibrio litoralis]
MPKRYALYFVPQQKTLLSALANGLLGRDIFSNTSVPFHCFKEISQQELEIATEEPRKYGLHATLKAPFYLKDNMTEQGLCLALEEFSKKQSSVYCPKLNLKNIDNFLGLTPAVLTKSEINAQEEISCFAFNIVKEFDKFRAELSEADLIRRKKQLLSLKQLEYLERFGYPFVADEYRFHLTLTSRILDTEKNKIFFNVFQTYLKEVLDQALFIDNITLCVQSEETDNKFKVHTV